METITLSTGDVFDGKVIGAATSEASAHNHDSEYVSASAPRTAGAEVRRVKCSACRWLETTLYVTRDGRYVVYTVGRSIVPGEKDYPRVTFTDSAYEVVELLTVKKTGEPFIPLPSARALAQAADRDDAVQEAYVNRAVYR